MMVGKLVVTVKSSDIVIATDRDQGCHNGAHPSTVTLSKTSVDCDYSRSGFDSCRSASQGVFRATLSGFWSWLFLSISLSGCSSHNVQPTERPSVTTGPPRWHYDVTLDSDTAHVKLCFNNAPAQQLVSSAQSDPNALAELRTTATSTPLSRQGQGFSLTPLHPNDCISYRVDFEALATSLGERRVMRLETATLARTSAWLWRPAVIPKGLQATIDLHAAPGVQVSVPWEPGPTPGSYRLDETAFRWLSFVAFGDLRRQQLHLADTDIELVVLGNDLDASDELLHDWCETAVQSSVVLFGTFPRPRLQVVVAPIAGGNKAIAFGLAARGGGPGAVIFMNPSPDRQGLIDSWTTSHELLHHTMPFIDDAWMSEGWTSYYTEIALTRTGHRNERDGWQELYDAFERGRANQPWGLTIQQASDQMHQRFAYRFVYWSGAAIALFTDIRLRQATNGQRSLDDAMRELRRCCGDATHTFAAEDLLADLDAWSNTDLFSTTAHEYLQRKAFPPVEEALRSIGVSVENGRVFLDDNHPHADLRRAIMLGSLNHDTRPIDASSDATTG